jgi:pyruvate/2-oxoglutarate dehydrogenase complex dihydrolipoamide dehydrogenase (E3) component
MHDIEHFDAVFLGGGAAAENFAPYLARGGERTAVIERRWIGGV